MQKLGLLFDNEANVTAGVLQSTTVKTCKVIQSIDISSLAYKADTLFAASIINTANNKIRDYDYKSVYLFEDFTDGVLAIFILGNDNNGYIITDEIVSPVILRGRMRSHNGIIWDVVSVSSMINQSVLDAADEIAEQQTINKELQNAITI